MELFRALRPQTLFDCDVETGAEWLALVTLTDTSVTTKPLAPHRTLLLFPHLRVVPATTLSPFL